VSDFIAPISGISTRRLTIQQDLSQLVVWRILQEQSCVQRVQALKRADNATALRRTNTSLVVSLQS
jgi:hypothetical protein